MFHLRTYCEPWSVVTKNATAQKKSIDDECIYWRIWMSNSRQQESFGSKQLIRNSTAEFLIFTGQSGEQSIEARFEDETIWLSQKLIAELFNVKVHTINEHLKNIFEQGEVTPEATIRKFRIVQMEGSREVKRNIDFYKLTKTSFVMKKSVNY